MGCVHSNTASVAPAAEHRVSKADDALPAVGVVPEPPHAVAFDLASQISLRTEASPTESLPLRTESSMGFTLDPTPPRDAANLSTVPAVRGTPLHDYRPDEDDLSSLGYDPVSESPH